MKLIGRIYQLQKREGSEELLIGELKSWGYYVSDLDEFGIRGIKKAGEDLGHIQGREVEVKFYTTRGKSLDKILSEFKLR